MSIVLAGEKGSITVTDATLGSLVTRAAERVSGVRVRRSRRHLEVLAEDGRIRVSLELGVPYGVVLPELARAVQGEVYDVLAAMTGLEVEAVDVAVEEVE